MTPQTEQMPGTIKVLHLITGLYRGGAEAMLVKLLRQMSGSRFASVVVSLAGNGAYETELRAAGIPVYVLGMRPTIPSLLKLPRLVGIVRRERPDFIQTWLYHADAVGLVVSGWARLPLAWNIQNSDMDLRNYRWSTRVVQRLLTWTSGWPDAVLVNSTSGKSAHAAIGYRPRRWEVIPTGYETERFRPDPAAPTRLRAELGLSSDTVLVGIAARNDPMKDYPSFLAAAERVAAADPAVRFVIAGRGTERLVVPPAIRSRVHVLGERDDMEQILPGLDLLCLSSRYGEGFPNILGEAMACAVPCIATDVGDSALLIADTGAVVPPADSGLLAGAMLDWIARGASARAQAGAAARRRIEQLFSIERVAARYQEFYTELLSTPPTREEAKAKLRGSVTVG